MTRIFEALRKSQGRPAALPFPPADPPPPRPAVVPRPAPAMEAGPFPRIESFTTAPLPEEVVRELTGLRIGLESALEGEATRVVMFVSPMRGDGVTTVATQFASVLAADSRGRSLLLDLHDRPAVPPARAVPGRSRGAAPVVAREGAAASRASRGGHPLGVAVMSDELRRAGGWSPEGVRSFLASVSAQFDWVIVDGPPVLEHPEAIEMAPLVNGVVLVVRSGQAKRPVIVRAAELLRLSGARLLGAVLNRRRLEIPDFIYRRI